MATIRPTSSSSAKKHTIGGLEPLSPEVPSFTTPPGNNGAQEVDNPITYTDTSKEVTLDHQEHKGVTFSDTAAAAAQHHCDNDDDESTSSSDEAEDAPQSKADILAAAGVSINLEELQMLQADQAPLELVTEFLRCVMSQEYYAARILCEYILRFEPDNATAREFYPTIMERIKLDEQMDTESSSSSSSSSTSGSDNGDTSSSSSDDDAIQPAPKKYSHSCHTHSAAQATNLQ